MECNHKIVVVERITKKGIVYVTCAQCGTHLVGKIPAPDLWNDVEWEEEC